MKVLLVEDEVKLGQAVKLGLEQDGYAVDYLTNFEDGLAYATTEEYDIIILDRMLPGGKDGKDICKQLRAQGSSSPVLMLTALGDTEDIVSSLDDGADDYLAKPFKFEELLARLRALRRRPVDVVQTTVKLDNLEINTTIKQVTRAVESRNPLVRNKQTKLVKQKIKLSKKEFAILEYLALNRGKISSKDQILAHVWDFDSDVLPNTVEAFIKSIRQKVDQPGKASIIETVRGFGYRLRTNDV